MRMGDFLPEITRIPFVAVDESIEVVQFGDFVISK